MHVSCDREILVLVYSLENTSINQRVDISQKDLLPQNFMIKQKHHSYQSTRNRLCSVADMDSKSVSDEMKEAVGPCPSGNQRAEIHDIANCKMQKNSRFIIDFHVFKKMLH